MSDELSAGLRELAERIDRHGLGIEGWESSSAHAWAGRLRELAQDAMLLEAANDSLRGRAEELGACVGPYPTEDELSPELRDRLMPEGMEWPRFEDGEPVRLGDEVYGLDGLVRVICFDDDVEDNVTIKSFTQRSFFNYGDRVMRPEPEANSSQCAPIPPNADSWEQLWSDAMREVIWTDELMAEFTDRAKALAGDAE